MPQNSPLFMQSAQNPSVGTVPSGQPTSNGQPQSPDAVKQLMEQMMKMLSTSNQGQSNVPLPKPPQPQGKQFQVGGIAGGIMGIIDSVKNRKQAQTAQQAESYYSQIQQYLTPTGDPQADAANRQKAEMFLSDPKIAKVLEKGIGYFQLTEQEPPPPEAMGVHAAIQSGKQKQGQGQPQGRMRPALPQGGPGGNQAQILSILKPLTEIMQGQANVTKTGMETGRAAAETDLVKQQYELGKLTNSTQAQLLTSQLESSKWKLENDKTLAPLQRVTLEKENAIKVEQLADLKSQARLRDAEAAWYRDGKPSTQTVLASYKEAVSSMDKSRQDAQTLMTQAKSERDKLQGWQNQYSKGGIFTPELKQLGFNTMEDFTGKLSQAESNFQESLKSYQNVVRGQQSLALRQQDILGGKYSLSQAVIDAYKAAGISMPKDVIAGLDDVPAPNSIDDEIMGLIK